MQAPAPVTDIEVLGARATLLERGFPYRELSALARADQPLTDSVYGVHKWWARRPRSVIRALVLAAHLPTDTPAERLWELFGADEPHLAGARVGDCFAGGGTTLVEAARLGADVAGIDVDPLAVRIVRDELAALPAPEDLATAGQAMLAALTADIGSLYPAPSPDAVPLHYFRLRRVTCDGCQTASLLYRSLVLARDAGRKGAVVREQAQVAFCPQCRCLHELGLRAKTLRCCGRRSPLDAGTFGRGGYRCPGCAQRRTLEQLRAASLPEELIAVEDTVAGGRRRLRGPSVEDFAALARADTLAAQLGDAVPSDLLDGVDDGRPARYGFHTVGDLFAPRQQLLFAHALSHLKAAGLDVAVCTRLELALSNAVHTNNRLCGYATDYGRLAAAFAGVRSYSLPILSVELNPLHPSAGRGSLPAMLRRLERSGGDLVRRKVLKASGLADAHMAARRPVRTSVSCSSADRKLPAHFTDFSAIVTDPPYYDYISYSDLSLLSRAWLSTDDGESLGGAPIFPVGDEPRTKFSRRLARALRNAAGALRESGALTFTYHSAHEDGWAALSDAVAAAGLSVTAVFPVWGDARSSTAHGHPGSCEWDLVWVCRPQPVAGGELPATTERWLTEIGDLLSDADERNLEFGLAAAHRAGLAVSRASTR
jgi:putative DNA methylase